MSQVADEVKPAEPHYPMNAVHLMRTVQLAQLQLSAMADTKANIVMGATFVIFTITIGKAQGASAPLPLLILGASAFFSAIFAILAVVPVTKRRRSAGEPNILFFGAFATMGEAEFIDQLMSKLHSDDSLYRTMARDIYQAGRVLQVKKYRMLNYAYRTLLVGLVASGLAYLILYLS
ncbi:MAG: Pycsar system effector family protein [Allosphingosinicella sp.]